MENNEISIHEILIYEALRRRGEWMTNHEIAKAVAQPVAERTVRHHTKRLTALGVLDLAEVFPGHRYRISDKREKRNAAYVQRIESASQVFGLFCVEHGQPAPGSSSAARGSSL